MSTPSPWQYFSVEELSCRCGCGLMNMDNVFMTKVVALRRELGWPFIVSSASRCSAHNQKVSNTGPNGPHTTGHAIDIVCSHEKALGLVSSALQHGITGLGVSQKGDVVKRFIHLDDLLPPKHSPRPNIWSY